MKKKVFKTRSLDTADFDHEPDLEGRIVEIDSMKVDDEDRAFMIIDNGNRLVRVFHSHALTEAFDLGEAGDHIRIEFRGKVKLSGKKTYRRYNVQVWNEEEVEGDDEVKETSV